MPIVTFTTDFGSGDGYAGAMKGVVLSLAPTPATPGPRNVFWSSRVVD